MRKVRVTITDEQGLVLDMTEVELDDMDDRIALVPLHNTRTEPSNAVETLKAVAE